MNDQWTPNPGQLQVREELLGWYKDHFEMVEAYPGLVCNPRYGYVTQAHLEGSLADGKPCGMWVVVGSVAMGKILGMHDGWEVLEGILQPGDQTLAILEVNSTDFPDNSVGPTNHPMYVYFLHTDDWAGIRLDFLSGKTPNGPVESRWVVYYAAQLAMLASV